VPGLSAGSAMAATARLVSALDQTRGLSHAMIERRNR
jgi:hypothetical protein